MAARCCRRTGLFRSLLSRSRTPGSGLCRQPRSALSSLPAAPPPPPGTWNQQLSRLSHRDLYRLSVTDPDRFWGSAAVDRLRWVKPFKRVQDCDLSSGRIRWFLGGKINVSAALPVFCSGDVTYVTRPPVELMNSLGAPGDNLPSLQHPEESWDPEGRRVAIYMPVSPMAVAAMVACARIGAVHTVVFAGFSAEALAGRIQDAQCKAVVTCNQGVRGGGSSSSSPRWMQR
ncbi:hypothetical protein INR49_022660 [Caranx melampygus]|nr:hypothetical protein INR49_022660 [Caranx melampygus]